jgi:hypothetical protein
MAMSILSLASTRQLEATRRINELKVKVAEDRSIEGGIPPQPPQPGYSLPSSSTSLVILLLIVPYTYIRFIFLSFGIERERVQAQGK